MASEGGIVAARVAADNSRVARRRALRRWSDATVRFGGDQTEHIRGLGGGPQGSGQRDEVLAGASVSPVVVIFGVIAGGGVAADQCPDLCGTRGPRSGRALGGPGVSARDAGLAGKDVVIDRVEGGDHGFNREGQSSHQGMLEVLGRVVDWFLTDSP
jgi:hypothetical protein